MVRKGRPPALPQGRRNTFGSRTAATINNSRVFPVTLQRHQQLLQLGTFGLNGNVQIGTMKAGNQNMRMGHVQSSENIIPRAFIRCCGQGQTRHIGKMAWQCGQGPVFRPELMPPGRNTMCFINSNNRKRNAGQSVQRAGR